MILPSTPASNRNYSHAESKTVCDVPEYIISLLSHRNSFSQSFLSYFEEKLGEIYLELNCKHPLKSI